MILSSTFQAPRGIRHMLYATEPGEVTPLFSFLFQALHQAGVVETYRPVNQTLLLAFDGVQYFFSSAIHGPQKRSEN